MSRKEKEFTLENYLYPEAYTYRFALYVVDEKKEVRFDYNVPGQPCPRGFSSHILPLLHPEWKMFRPSDVKICIGHNGSQYQDSYHDTHKECLSKFPRKVLVDGEVYFYRPTLLDHGDRKEVLRELRAYRSIQEDGEMHVPRLYGVVVTRDDRLLGFLLSRIDCENKMLECIIMHNKLPSELRLKWQYCLSSSLVCLHGDWVSGVMQGWAMFWLMLMIMRGLLIWSDIRKHGLGEHGDG